MAERILIIDDSWIARMKLGQAVKAAGYEVLEADSAEGGIEAVDREKPDLILLDLLMPGIGGMGVLTKLRERGHAVPVIVVTADIQQTTRGKCLESGASAVVNKPPQRDHLLEEIEALLSDGGARS